MCISSCASEVIVEKSPEVAVKLMQRSELKTRARFFLAPSLKTVFYTAKLSDLV